MPPLRASTVAICSVLSLWGGFSFNIHASRSADTAAPPSTLDPAVREAYRWRSIGPARAGRSIAVSGVNGRPNEAYAGQAGGGLWKTIDRGDTWTPITDGQINSSSVGAVAVSESNPDIVFIGMGES